jgi:putative sterol carrier protein
MDSAFSSTEELATALREALAISAERALTALGQQGGFADSETYQIPLPATVEKLRKPLELVNQDYRLDAFKATMNSAAEAGVAAAPAIVKDAINSLTLEDLNDLWQGEDDAITRFLEKKSRSSLSEKMLPLISEATDASGATRSYKEIQSAIPTTGGGFFSKIQAVTGLSTSDFDLDQYVNDQALDGLFAAMAIEEKAIREDPVARSTDLLKKLFSE